MTTFPQDTSISKPEVANGDISIESESITTISSPSSLTPYLLNIINTFPWINEFIKLCHEDMINVNGRNLEKLMNFYHHNAIISVKECYSEPIRVSILKRSMSDVMLYFHMTYSELKLPFESSSFLAKMSDLMALYLDMEIEASRSGIESLQNIASKITSCLFIYFGCSHVHILDTILKTKMINRDSWELSDLIFRRVLRDPPGPSVDVITFIRYLLAFKLWKGIMGSAEERKKIQLMAENQLIPPPDFKEILCCNSVLRDMFPRIPESETNITRFFLEVKFVTRDTIEMFMKEVADQKLQCALNSQNFSLTNYTYSSNEQEDDKHNWLMEDWPNVNIESANEDNFILNKSNFGFGKLNHTVRSISKSGLEKKWMNADISIEHIGEDENSFKAGGVFKKDQIYRDDSFWEGDEMDVAAEVELPSSPLEVTEIPTIKLEPQPSQSKDNPWDIPSTYSYQNYNDFDSKSEIIVEKAPEQTMINLHNKSQFYNNKAQEFGTCSSIEEQSSTQGFDLLHSEQILTESKSIEVLRTQIVNEKYFPSDSIDIPSGKDNHGILYEENNKEVSSEEQNEKLCLEDHNELSSEECNEEMHQRDLDVNYINKISSGECNRERHFEECTSEKSIDSNNVERSIEQSEETPPEKRGLVHDFTLKNDNKIYKFHLKLSSYWEKLNRHTWINLLFPLFSEQDTKTPRCNCLLCTQNYNTIMKNWKSALTNLSHLPIDFSDTKIFSGNLDNIILKEMKELLETDGLKLLVWEHEMDEVYTKILELIKKENSHYNLPLKKRKALSLNSDIKDEKKEISYPNTPMISIAEVELVKEKYRLSEMNMNHSSTCNVPPPPINYVPDYLSYPSYHNPADIKSEDVMVSSNITNIPSNENPAPVVFPTTFATDHQEQDKPVFKTPAQLKEFQHLSAAEDLLNFSLSPRSYCNENQEPRSYDEREIKKSRIKTKSSRKRKQKSEI